MKVPIINVQSFKREFNKIESKLKSINKIPRGDNVNSITYYNYYKCTLIDCKKENQEDMYPTNISETEYTSNFPLSISSSYFWITGFKIETVEKVRIISLYATENTGLWTINYTLFGEGEGFRLNFVLTVYYIYDGSPQNE